jgi:hypothetical protein
MDRSFTMRNLAKINLQTLVGRTLSPSASSFPPTGQSATTNYTCRVQTFTTESVSLAKSPLAENSKCENWPVNIADLQDFKGNL